MANRQIGVKCVRGKISHKECRACALRPDHPCGYTPDMLEQLRQENQGEPEADAFTPTRLLDCDRKTVLLTDHDWYVDVEKSWPLMRGTAVHAFMERTGENYPGVLRVIREERFETTVETKYGPQLFRGKPDQIVILSGEYDGKPEPHTLHIKIVDYKTKAEVDHELTAASREHQMQVNMYAYLAAKCLPSFLGRDILNIVVDELEIEYLGWKKPRRFTSAAELTTKGKMTRRKPPEYELLHLEPIHLLTMKQIEKYIVWAIEKKLEARENIPPPLQGEAAKFCDWCPVQDDCAALARKGI